MDMLVQITLKELERIDDQIAELNTTREAVVGSLVAMCPVQIGGIIQVNGYSHRGKPMRVSDVYVVRERGGKRQGYRWKARGFVLKANGEVGVQKGEWTSEDFI